MSYITTQRKHFSIITDAWQEFRPKQYDDWRTFWALVKSLDVRHVSCARWIIYRTNPGQTRRDLFASLNAPAIDTVAQSATLATPAGRNEA